MAMMKFYKYQGAGNDFLIADNRDGHITESEGILTAVLEDGTLWSRSIADLCDRRYGVGADGLMLLDPGMVNPEGRQADTDFHMTYFNSDGSGGMMCGNGGRCIVAFAYDCGVIGDIPEQSECNVGKTGYLVKYTFTAADGPHEAYIYEDNQATKIVGLMMKDVHNADHYNELNGVVVPSEGYFLDTGTRHYVRFVEDVDKYDIVTEGRDIRYNAQELQPVGANVNFVEACEDYLKVRTYEKGVEDETFACGTGIVASALAAYTKGVRPKSTSANGRIHYDIRAKRDRLMVDFLSSEQGVAQQIFLTGPAAKVCEIVL
jgi:diaminopimelate epimerase